MLAELFDRIVKLGREADAVQLVEHPKLPGKVCVRRGAEPLAWMDTPPPRRGHVFNSFADLVAAASDRAIAEEPEVFHSPGQVIVLLNRAERREMVSLPLVLTQRFASVCAIPKDGRSFDVGGAVRFIRFDLHGCGVDALVAQLRKVDFSRKSTGASTVEHGKESLGKSIEMSVQQAADIPESFLVELPVFANNGLRSFRAQVRCGLYLDMQNEQIVIKPLADEVATAIDAAQAWLHEQLCKALNGVPVFCGEPKLL